jgi:hypothetical protein
VKHTVVDAGRFARAWVNCMSCRRQLERQWWRGTGHRPRVTVSSPFERRTVLPVTKSTFPFPVTVKNRSSLAVPLVATLVRRCAITLHSMMMTMGHIRTRQCEHIRTLQGLGLEEIRRKIPRMGVLIVSKHEMSISRLFFRSWCDVVADWFGCHAFKAELFGGLVSQTK